MNSGTSASINSLPDEVLEKIFDFLPAHSLESMLTVSQRYKNIITSRVYLMDKIDVVIANYSKDRCSLENVNGDCVTNLYVHGQVAEDQIMRFPRTRKLTMSISTNEQLQRNLNLLDDLVFVEMKSSSQTPPEKVTLKPKLLEEVIINYDHAEFIDANVQIKKLSINYNVLSFHPVDTSADFFYEQTKLTSLNMINLHLGAQRCRIFRDIVPDKIKFRLKHLAMVYTCNDNNMYVLENIAKFIKSQKELRTISLKGPVSFEMWHAIMELPLLEKLEFTSHFLCKFALSGRVRRSPSLKELVITGDMKNEVFRNILDYMPGITKLVNKGTFFMNKVHLKHLAEKVPNLHTLHLRVFDTDVDFKEPFVFKNLKDMKIEAVKMHQGFSDRCVNFVRMFPAIERMIFLQGTFKSHIPFSVMDKLLYKLENLQYLELGPTFVNSNVIEYISQNPGRALRVLKFSMDEYLGPKKLNELFADTKVQVYEMDIYVKVRATEYLTNRFLDPIASDVDGCEFFNNYGYYDGRHDGYGDEDEESDDYDNDNYY